MKGTLYSTLMKFCGRVKATWKVITACTPYIEKRQGNCLPGIAKYVYECNSKVHHTDMRCDGVGLIKLALHAESEGGRCCSESLVSKLAADRLLVVFLERSTQMPGIVSLSGHWSLLIPSIPV